MNKILICTHNQGKLLEISSLLKNLPAEIVSLKDLNIALDVEETGETYEENAILKAKTYGEMSGLISIADDTGLEVAALNGAPGVHSKRYFKTSGEERNQELLKLIGDNPNKKAKFAASVAVYNPKNKEIKTFFGEIPGEIISTPKGSAHAHLGYDSVFYAPILEKTFAEASLEEKYEISHRALAVNKAKEYINSLL